MNLLVAETKLYGESFLLGQQLSSQGHRVLEIAPFGHQGYFLAETLADFKAEGLQSKSSNLKSVLIQNVNDDLLAAYLSLKNNPVQKYILFLTYEGPVEAFAKAQTLLEKDYKVVDFRFLKHKKPAVHLILTTDNADVFEKLDESSKQNAVFFKADGRFLKDYFSIVATN